MTPVPVKDFLAQFGSPQRIVVNILLLAAGSALCALAVNGILVPHNFVSGGLVGVTLLVHHSWPGLSIAAMLLAMNAVIFLVGWRYVGLRFLLYSLAGMLIFIAAIAYIKVPVPIEDKMLAAILAGIITGGGSGLILRSQGSAGGLDILAVIMMERFSIRLGSTALAVNSLILAAAAVIISLQGALYTLVFMFVTAQVTDLVVTGMSRRKVVHIISRQWQAISQRVLSDMKRGLTLIPARGGFSGAEIHFIYVVVSFRDIARIKRLVRAIDPDAFVVINDTMEVLGANLDSVPQWSGRHRPPGKRPPEPKGDDPASHS